MSHFTSVKTKLKDIQCLKQALEDLKYEFVEADEHQGVQVRGYNNQHETADMCIRVSKKYDVGVKITEHGVEFLADWWGVETTHGLTEDEFVNKLTQRYAYHKVVKEIEARGFSLEEEETEENTIQLTVSKWL